MPTLQATELIDERRLKVNREGGTGQRVYLVNTGLADVAVFGNADGPPLGLPVLGDVWNLVTAKYLVCVELAPERQGGQDTDAVNRTNAWTRVLARYETLGLHGSLPPPQSGISFSRVLPSTTGFQALYGIDPATGNADGNGQLVNGRGASADAGLLAFEVFKPLSPTEPLDLPRLNTLHSEQRVNDAPVNVPPLLGRNQAYSFSRGELRMAGFAPEDPDQTGWRYVRYLLHAARHHRKGWYLEGPDGRSTGERREAHLYRYGDFSGLW